VAEIKEQELLVMDEIQRLIDKESLDHIRNDQIPDPTAHNSIILHNDMEEVARKVARYKSRRCSSETQEVEQAAAVVAECFRYGRNLL